MAGSTPLLVAQADDQAAPAQSEAKPATTKPATTKPERKPAPKSPAAAPATTTAQPQPAGAAPPAATAAPAPPKPPPSTAAEPQPLVHASQAGVKACLDGIGRAALATIDTDHAAISQWSTGAADAHVFESIISLAYPNRIAPRAAAVLLAAPTQSQSCDTSTVQVFPTARPCNAVLADLLKNGKIVADLAGVPISQNSTTGARQILMPTAGNGCVMVVVTLTFGK